MQLVELDFKINDIVEGKVLRIKPFGAIVQLPNQKQGLVHISHVSQKFIQDINEHVKVDDVVKVKILEMDIPNNKISLSMKDAMPREPKPQKTFTTNKEQPATIPNTFEDIMSGWLKDSNDKQATLNKRAKRR